MSAPSHSPPAALTHRLLFLRCAVHRAEDLFRLEAPLEGDAPSEIVRWVREQLPRRTFPGEGIERRFGVTPRLLALEEVLHPGFRVQSERVFRQALQEGRHRAELLLLRGGGGPEDGCTFVVLPAWRRCYTVVWRFLSVLDSGEREEEGFIPTEAANRLLGLLRRGLRLGPRVHLDLYPHWVNPAAAPGILDQDRRRLREQDPLRFRMPRWEGDAPCAASS